MRRTTLSLTLVAALGCGAPSSPTDAAMPDAPRDAAVADAWLAPAPAFDGSHTFPAVELAPGDEELDQCQAWTLDNDAPIYVNAVVMDAGPGWHHSNWMVVPDTLFPGEDGTFPCRDRGFDELTAALGGGGVFFAQSTQSTHEEQRFEPGAAYVIPPHARVIGAIHLFNLSAEPVSTALTFHVEGIASTDVQTVLHPLALDNRGLELAPRSTTETTMDCDLAHIARHVSMRIHYVLPHYHGLATIFRLEVIGGPNDGQAVFETNAAIGDPLGATLPVPYDLTGATGLRLTCTYENPSDETVSWGAYRLDEMCMVLAYTDDTRTYGGQAPSIVATETLPDGTIRQTGNCITIGN